MQLQKKNATTKQSLNFWAFIKICQYLLVYLAFVFSLPNRNEEELFKVLPLICISPSSLPDSNTVYT